MTARPGSAGSRWLAVLPLALATLASLALLLYAGYGEGRRVYVQLRLERIAALGEVLASSMETFTQTGLPVRQFAGFEAQAAALNAAGPSILAVRVLDPAGRTVFEQPAGAATPAAGHPARYALSEPGSEVWQAGDRLRVLLPVRDKMAVAATIAIDVDEAALVRPVAAALWPALLVAAAGGLLFLLVELGAAGRSGRFARLAPSLVFAGAFIAVAGTVTAGLFGLYDEGVRGKTAALAQSIAHRLSAATEIGIDFSSFSELGEAFAVYRRIDPDIRRVTLVDDGKVLVDSAAAAAGRPYRPDADVYEFSVPLAERADLGIAVALPKAVVLRAMWRNGKNFLALFLACGLVGYMLLPASRALAARPAGADPAAAAERRLAIVKAAYFLGVFVDAIGLSFLPQWATTAATAAGLSPAAGSLPFTLSFVFLTAALLPAGRYAVHGDLRRMMLAGLACTAAGAVLIFAWPGFVAICAGRSLSGLGQALLLVAVQSYGLSSSAGGRQARAVGVQVEAFSGGLICGTTIGGLLAALLDERRVFLIGGGLGLAALLYAVSCIAPGGAERRAGAPRALLADLRAALLDAGFLKTLFLGGVGKFVFAGVAMFAVPLILRERGYAKEDVGQVMTLYALAVLGATLLATRLADRLGGAGAVLLLGSVVAGLGMALVGLVNAGPGPEPAWLAAAAAALAGLPVPAILLTILGVLAMGVSQGMLAAPVITYVAGTAAAARDGPAGVVAIYRLLERVGHICGPVVVGAVLAAWGGDPASILIFGLLSLVAGLLFLALGGPRPAALSGAPR
ncbi:MAG: MFS transporter [Dongiaceae bacterium]